MERLPNQDCSFRHVQALARKGGSVRHAYHAQRALAGRALTTFLESMEDSGRFTRQCHCAALCAVAVASSTSFRYKSAGMKKLREIDVVAPSKPSTCQIREGRVSGWGRPTQNRRSCLGSHQLYRWKVDCREEAHEDAPCTHSHRVRIGIQPATATHSRK